MFPLNVICKHQGFFSFWVIYYRILKAWNSMGINRYFSKQWMEEWNKERAKYFISKFKLIALDQSSMRDQLSCGLEGKSDSPVICVCKSVCLCVAVTTWQFQRPMYSILFHVLDVQHCISTSPFEREDYKYINENFLFCPQCLLFLPSQM